MSSVYDDVQLGQDTCIQYFSVSMDWANKTMGEKKEKENIERKKEKKKIE